MNEMDGMEYREHAKRKHRNTSKYVSCPCRHCNGAAQRPQTSQAHMKRQRREENEASRANEGQGLWAGPSGEGRARTASTREPSPQPLSREPSAERELSIPREFHTPPQSPPPPFDPPVPDPPVPDPPVPEPPAHSPPRSLPRSLGSNRSRSRRSSSSEGQRPHNRPRAQSDGDLSDVAAAQPNHGFEGRGNAFFAHLLDNQRELDEGDDDQELGELLGGDHRDMFDGDGLDEDYGIPAAQERPNDEPLWDLNHLGNGPDREPAGDPDNPGDDPDDDRQHFAAFDEPDVIRNIYVDAYIQKTHYPSTHSSLQHQLRSHRRALQSNPDISPDDIAKMAMTIQTVERRLGMTTSDIITTYTLCPDCKRRYSPTHIANADINTCNNEGCNGVLFDIKELASGTNRRVSRLTYPVASIIAWLRRVFSFPGMAELMQNFRDGPDDNEEGTAPISPEEWRERLNLDHILSDISTGYGWRAAEAGMERIVDLEGDARGEDLVYDRSTLDSALRFVSLRFGLSLSMNTDWFQSTKEGNYSVGAVYFVINNLPRHLRYLRENICLAAILPGPNEPNSYALDQMLEPIIQDLLDLQSGVEMRVRVGDPPQHEECIIHGDLHYHIADLIARIKLGGGAGVASEMNFCLHCRTRLSALSVAAGFERQNFPHRDPHEDLQNAYFWKNLETEEARRVFFEETGNRFTILHALPGWHTANCSPPDAMHLLYLGGVNWILKQVIVGPDLLAVRQPGAEKPIDIYNATLGDMWVPYSVGRLPPRLGQTSARVKADQLKIMSKIMFVPLYLAMRDGDDLSETDVPRGTKRSPGGKHQYGRAKLLFNQRVKHFNAIREPELAPVLANCFASRNIRRHYKQILRFCVALSVLDSRSISLDMIHFAQSLLETLCVEYTRMNVPLSPNFHYMMHLEEFMLRTGSLYNTHVWPMERANGMLGRINHNGKGKGVLEGTIMRGWWEHTSLQSLIRRFQSLPNRTAADNAIVEELLIALRGGPEHAQQRGTLMAFIAQSRTAYTRLHGIQESTRLSTHSRDFKLDRVLHPLVVDFCDRIWPNEGIFGPGQVRHTYLPAAGAVRNFSYVEHDGLRYGAFTHTFGRRACYGYVNPQVPVRIERILLIEIPDRPELRTICAVVRRFHHPQIEPAFPWNAWKGHLGVAHWQHNELSDLILVPVSEFAGIFALLTVPTSYARYWVTVSLNTLEPEEEM